MTTSDSANYQGIDVSDHQKTIEWFSVKETGITFAFVKATQGVSEIDPYFTTNWSSMKEASIVRGAYHYFDPGVDAQTQAEHFINTVGTLEPGDLPPVLDVEITEGVSVKQLNEDITVWLEAVAQAFSVKPVIYSYLSFVEENLASGFSTYPLWIAAWSSSPPAVPGDWSSITFWQYSDSGKISGVDGNVDLDMFLGTRAEWDKLLMSVTP